MRTVIDRGSCVDRADTTRSTQGDRRPARRVVRHNPYDRHPPITPECETLPKRVLVGQYVFAVVVVDDGDELPVSAIAIRKKRPRSRGT